MEEDFSIQSSDGPHYANSWSFNLYIYES